MDNKIISSSHELIEQIPLFLLFEKDFKVEFKNHFQANSPSIYADIESLSINSNCSCKNKVKSYISQNKDEIANIINSFFNNKDISIFDKVINDIRSQLPVDLTGKILKTTIKNWEAFGKAMEKNIFRSFSIVKENDDIYVYFL